MKTSFYSYHASSELQALCAKDFTPNACAAISKEVGIAKKQMAEVRKTDPSSYAVALSVATHGSQCQEHHTSSAAVVLQIGTYLSPH